MKDEKIFDILEGAEGGTMERLISKCPEIPDEELDDILEMSERKYYMKKKEMSGNSIGGQPEFNGATVSGVERVKKFSWTKPLTIAASFVLIAGLAAGSISLMNKNRTGSADSGIGVSDTAVTGTSEVTTAASEPASGTVTTSAASAAVTTETVTETVTEAVIVTEPVVTDVYTEPGTEPDTEPVTDTEPTEVYSEPETEPETENTEKTFAVLNIEDITGEWEFQISDGSAPIDENPIYNGTITINDIGIYEYTNADGNVITGSVRTNFEGLTDPVVPSVAFYSYTKLLYEGYCYDTHPDVILIGDGTYARLVRK